MAGAGRPQLPLSVSEDSQDEFEYDETASFQITRPVLLTICATFLGEFLASADDSLMISTYTAIASEFRDLTDGSWLLVAYGFGYCIASPVYGVLGDLFGRKNVILWSYLLFMLGCLASGASASMVQLILSRVLAGISGAGMISLVSVIVTDIVPPKEIALFRSYADITNTIGRSLGAPIGGFLVQTVGWRSSFYGQLPILIISVIITAYNMPSTLNQTPQESTKSKIKKIDFLGILSFTVTILLLLFLLQCTDFSTIEQSPLFYLLGGLFVGVGSAFLLIEMFWAENPLIPVDMIQKACGGYCLSQAFLAVGRNAFGATTVPYFIRVDYATDLTASLPNVASMIGVLIGSLFAGFWIKRTNHYRTISIIAASCMALSYLTVFARWRNGCNIWEALILVPFGFTLGIQYSTQYIGMEVSVPKARIGQCNGTYYLFEQLGCIVGPVIGLATVEKGFRGSLGRYFEARPGKDAVIDKILNDARYAFSLPETDQQVVRWSYLQGYQSVPLFGCACAFLTLFMMVFLRERPIQ